MAKKNCCYIANKFLFQLKNKFLTICAVLSNTGHLYSFIQLQPISCPTPQFVRITFHSLKTNKPNTRFYQDFVLNFIIIGGIKGLFMYDVSQKMEAPDPTTPLSGNIRNWPPSSLKKTEISSPLPPLSEIIFCPTPICFKSKG